MLYYRCYDLLDFMSEMAVNPDPSRLPNKHIHDLTMYIIGRAPPYITRELKEMLSETGLDDPATKLTDSYQIRRMLSRLYLFLQQMTNQSLVEGLPWAGPYFTMEVEREDPVWHWLHLTGLVAHNLKSHAIKIRAATKPGHPLHCLVCHDVVTANRIAVAIENIAVNHTKITAFDVIYKLETIKEFIKDDSALLALIPKVKYTD